MKSRFKIALLICLAVATVAAACTLCACGGKTRRTENYTAYGISSAEVVQKTSKSYGFTLGSDIAPSESSRVYITRYDKIPEGAQPVAYTEKDGKYVFEAEVSSVRYYLWVTDGEKTAVLPMTNPQMAPSLTVTAAGNVLTYNFVKGTSWSSFCDPAGKAVYKSASPVYGADASAVARQVSINGVDSTTDISASADKPYYFVVLTAKNGAVTFVSAPVVACETAFSDLKVSLCNDGGKPVLAVSGTFKISGDAAAELYSADERLGRVTEVSGESVSGAAGEKFNATVDVSGIVSGTSGAGIWFDIKIAASSGAMYELSSDCADFSQQLLCGNVTFEFKEWNGALKLNYDYYDFAVNSVKIESGSGAPVLIVEGVILGDIREIKLHASADGKDLEWSDVSTASGKFRFEAPLAELPAEGTPWCWFHINVYSGNTTVPTQTDLNRGGNLKTGDRYEYDGTTYTVREYAGGGTQLVIQAEKK